MAWIITPTCHLFVPFLGIVLQVIQAILAIRLIEETRAKRLARHVDADRNVINARNNDDVFQLQIANLGFYIITTGCMGLNPK